MAVNTQCPTVRPDPFYSPAPRPPAWAVPRLSWEEGGCREPWGTGCVGACFMGATCTCLRHSQGVELPPLGVGLGSRGQTAAPSPVPRPRARLRSPMSVPMSVLPRAPHLGARSAVRGLEVRFPGGRQGPTRVSSGRRRLCLLRTGRPVVLGERVTESGHQPRPAVPSSRGLSLPVLPRVLGRTDMLTAVRPAWLRCPRACPRVCTKRPRANPRPRRVPPPPPPPPSPPKSSLAFAPPRLPMQRPCLCSGWGRSLPFSGAETPHCPPCGWKRRFFPVSGLGTASKPTDHQRGFLPDPLCPPARPPVGVPAGAASAAFTNAACV